MTSQELKETLKDYLYRSLFPHGIYEGFNY